MSDEQETPNSTEETEETSLLTEKPEEQTTTTTEEPKPEEVVPLTVEDLAIPEGYEVIEPLRDKFLEILNGDMSPKERAEALLGLHKETLDAASETDSTAWNTMQEEWKAEAKKEFGEKLQPTLTNIGKLIDEYGTEDLRTAFSFTGAGNNVHVIKFLGKIAEALTEGTHTGGSAGGELTDEQRAARLFPSMKG